MSTNYQNILKATSAQVAHAILQLPKILGNTAINFSKDRFKTQSWLGASVQKWPARIIVKKKSSSRALLIKTSRLLKSIHVTFESTYKVVIGTVMAHGRRVNLPRRQFIGQSPCSLLKSEQVQNLT